MSVYTGQYVHGDDRYAKVAELNAKIPSGEYELVRGPEDMGLDFSNPLYAELEREGANALYESVSTPRAQDITVSLSTPE